MMKAEPCLSKALELSEDAFLGGKVRALQPKKGFRAGVDSVLLAAAVTARPGQSILELGCGTGVASLCLASRVENLTLHGLEPQPEYVDIARMNFDRSEYRITIHKGSVDSEPAELRSQRFDLVFANPPYFKSGEGAASADQTKDIAFRDATHLSLWIDCALRRLKDHGVLTLIQRIDRLPEILIALDGRSGDTRVKPIIGREGKAPKRFLLQSRKCRSGPFTLLPPLIMHDLSQHESDTPDYSPLARRLLREGAALEL